jgi:quercetin dioxygenase-like cupin family protein
MIGKFVVILSLAALPTAAQAQINPSQLSWSPAPASLPKGAEVSILTGNPAEKGPFVMRLRMPPGYGVPAHHHPTDEFVTVISGDAYFGMGDKLDPEKGTHLVTGGFIRAAAGMNHFAYSPTASVVQIQGEGPFEIVYVDPADDPRNQ